MIAESNSHEAVNDAQVDEIPDIDGEDGDDDEEEAEGEQEDEYESDEEEHYWYDCPWCKEIWLQEKSRDDHMVTCSKGFNHRYLYS